LWLIQAERFDLYLLDAWLPGVDGFELCRQIRIADPQTPILFFTGAAYAADTQKGIEAGANAYVVKPDVDGLLESITKFITPVVPQPTMPWMSSKQNQSLGRIWREEWSIRLDS
jgi:DNA-binding response OmpR family regulator